MAEKQEWPGNLKQSGVPDAIKAKGFIEQKNNNIKSTEKQLDDIEVRPFYTEEEKQKLISEARLEIGRELETRNRFNVKESELETLAKDALEFFLESNKKGEEKKKYMGSYVTIDRAAKIALYKRMEE